MKSVCAWCGNDLIGDSLGPKHEADISHGICSKCAKKLVSAKIFEFREYLDKLPAPILVVDGDGVVKTANKAAVKLLKKDISKIEDSRGGDVFECAYAKLPEGCGRTVHCSGCTIRRSVMDTISTGKPIVKSPAYLTREITGGKEELEFLISTEKSGNVVLLRIDDMKKKA